MATKQAQGCHVLVIDEELRDHQAFLHVFRRYGAEVSFAQGVSRGRSALRLRAWDVVLLELQCCGDEELALVSEVRRLEPPPVTVASFSRLSAESAILLQEVSVVLLPNRCPPDLLVRLAQRRKERVASDALGASAVGRATGATATNGASGGPPRWVPRVRTLLNCAELSSDEKAPLREMLELVMRRTLHGRGASWRELARALGRTSGHQASDGYVRQQVFRMRRRFLPSVAVSLNYSRSRGYFFSACDS
jgi:hypothetical protein